VLPGEGVWQPVGSLVDGLPAVYVTRVRPDSVHTSVLASLMWIDTDLTKSLLVPGYLEPGGPSPSQGALPTSLWPSVLANFNGGFRSADSRGGYFYQGDTVKPLVKSRASAVITKDGHLQIGAWGRDVRMTPTVSVVLQNLDLIVDGGRSMVAPGDNFQWGATTHGESFAWRSALGQRADGSLVYIGSPGLSAQTMASTLVNAGVVRAMVLDMNNWWVAGFYFTHSTTGAPVCAKLDPNIAEGCNRFLARYKRDSFQILAAP
jgi:Phosphodiester glycosidase